MKIRTHDSVFDLLEYMVCNVQIITFEKAMKILLS